MHQGHNQNDSLVRTIPRVVKSVYQHCEFVPRTGGFCIHFFSNSLWPIDELQPFSVLVPLQKSEPVANEIKQTDIKFLLLNNIAFARDVGVGRAKTIKPLFYPLP